MAARPDPSGVKQFVALCGADVWRKRLAAIGKAAAANTRLGRQLQQTHAVELLIERLRAGVRGRALSPAEVGIGAFVAETVALAGSLRAPGRERLLDALRQGLTAEGSLISLIHVVRTAAMQRARGFEVSFAGLEEGAPFDLLIRRDGAEAEIACDVVSAEDGHGVHRGAWFSLVDRIDPDLQIWLRAHPGRYLLKLTFPSGLRMGESAEGVLPALHARITQMLADRKQSDSDPAVVLRLDPLLLAAAQADELGLMPRLRQEFGPEAHLAVTAAGGGIFVMAARAGQQNEVAAAVRRRMAAVAPARLTGSRPGILAMFVEDIDRLEWRLLRERLELEGEARQFMTNPEARPVIAVTCTSRLELFGIGAPDGVAEGELRFRNPGHPDAKRPGLAPAVLSSV